MTDSHVTIRPIHYPEEYPAVFELWSHAGPGVRVGRSDSLEEMDKKLQRDPDLFIVAETNGQIIGSVIGGYDGRRGMIYHLAVHTDYRGRGIGERLMAEVEDRLRAKGCVKAYLLVTNDNTDVIDFYGKRGWDEMDMHLLGKTLS